MHTHARHAGRAHAGHLPGRKPSWARDTAGDTDTALRYSINTESHRSPSRREHTSEHLSQHSQQTVHVYRQQRMSHPALPQIPVGVIIAQTTPDLSPSFWNPRSAGLCPRPAGAAGGPVLGGRSPAGCETRSTLPRRRPVRRFRPPTCVTAFASSQGINT